LKSKKNVKKKGSRKKKEKKKKNGACEQKKCDQEKSWARVAGKNQLKQTENKQKKTNTGGPFPKIGLKIGKTPPQKVPTEKE